MVLTFAHPAVADYLRRSVSGYTTRLAKVQAMPLQQGLHKRKDSETKGFEELIYLGFP